MEPAKELDKKNYVTLEQAQELANNGYRGPTDDDRDSTDEGPTEAIWDRYSPDGVNTAWRLIKSRHVYDDTCCLAAPSLSEYDKLKDS